MKASIATHEPRPACLLASAAAAQTGRRPSRPTARRPNADRARRPTRGLPGRTRSCPRPTAPDQIKPATLALPTDPIEPWLLTKEAGPFMVIAKTFRGPEAERYALALAMELRRDYRPARLTSSAPRTSRCGPTSATSPRTAPAYVNKAHLTEPEKVRSYDEAAVLVGNEKTLADSEALLHKVKKIKPKCLDEMPSIFGWRAGQGLSTAIRTTNPYQPTQNLFPGRGQRDPLIAQMNGGPRSIYKCPGRYSLQVAAVRRPFAVVNPRRTSRRRFGDGWLKKSPLATAHDDAEDLADVARQAPRGPGDRASSLRLPRPDVEQGHGRLVQLAERPRRRPVARDPLARSRATDAEELPTCV